MVICQFKQIFDEAGQMDSSILPVMVLKYEGLSFRDTHVPEQAISGYISVSFGPPVRSR
jgi:hypothetical protein